MSKRWKTNPTFNVRFPLGKHHFIIKAYTTERSKIYVINFVVFEKIWFLVYISNIQATLYVSFSIFWVFTSVDYYS